LHWELPSSDEMLSHRNVPVTDGLGGGSAAKSVLAFHGQSACTHRVRPTELLHLCTIAAFLADVVHLLAVAAFLPDVVVDVVDGTPLHISRLLRGWCGGRLYADEAVLAHPRHRVVLLHAAVELHQ
jgi:hypothetical protein